MAAISLSIKRGNDGFRIDSFTVGVLAPNADDLEFRYNTTDANSATITRKDVVQALEAFIRAVESDALFINPLGI
jgi:hypothetical protein